jgi:hypothetical protein
MYGRMRLHSHRAPHVGMWQTLSFPRTRANTLVPLHLPNFDELWRIAWVIYSIGDHTILRVLRLNTRMIEDYSYCPNLTPNQTYAKEMENPYKDNARHLKWPIRC